MDKLIEVFVTKIMDWNS